MMRHTYSALLLVLLFASTLGCSQDPTPTVSAAQLTATAPSGQNPGTAMGTLGSLDLIADFERECGNAKTLTAHCRVLRSLLAVEVTVALESIARSRDQRGAEAALAALALTNEPEILVAAGRLLGRLSDTPGIGGKVLPLMVESPYVEVQRVAAQALSQTTHPLADVGQMWSRNHTALPNAGAYTEYPGLPAHYASLGFPKYPGAEWFSPADSDRSVGWSTKDDVTVVARWFAQALRAEAMDIQRWGQLLAGQAPASAGPDQSLMTRLQQLTERAIRGDQAALAEIDKLQKQLDNAQQNAPAVTENGVDQVAQPPTSSGSEARWIIAQKKDGRISRLVLVYPLPALKRTVIQHAWDLTDYPNAWPKPKPELTQ